MSENSFDLASLFPRAVIGGGKNYLSRTLHVPVLPEVFGALARASVSLHTPSGMGGSFTLKKVMTPKKDGKYVFAVDHTDFQFSVTVTAEDMPGKIFWKAVVPVGFTPEMAPGSILARCWNDDLARQISELELLRCSDYFNYRGASMLGAEKGFSSYTGMDFILKRHIPETLP